MKKHPVIPITPLQSTTPSEGNEIEVSLFAKSKTVYARSQKGWFNSWRWLLVVTTQLLFYGAVWLTWNDRQAVLFDLLSRKFYIFGLILWPQDFIYLAILLVISALSLFLFTAIAGRLFCGYACPQTVYTELFMWIERKIEGDRNARMKLDQSPLSFRKIRLKTTKHLVWLSVALWTGFTFVGYFTPIHTLTASVVNFSLGPWETFWLLFYGFATYGNAGFLREQVCKYMCPYARFQSAMFDKDTLIVTYDVKRGEPRGSRNKKVDYKAHNLGSCVDCNICVQVCPTGIDIRNGLQYECIACGLCIDACNQVMDKMEYEPGLIRYTTEHALIRNFDKQQMWQRVFRLRTLIYSGILCLIIFATGLSLAYRVPLKVDVIRDRSMPKITETGAIENVYRLQIMNTHEKATTYVISVEGIAGASIVNAQRIDIAATSSKTLPVRVNIPANAAPAGSNRIKFKITDVDESSNKVVEKSVFLVPR